MSIGLKFIQAVLASGNPSPLRDLRPEFFVGPEESAFNMVRDHYRRYHELPDPDTLRSEGIRLPRASEPAAFYADKIRQRFVYNVVNGRNKDLAKALRAQDSVACMQVIREMAAMGAHILNPAEFTTLAATALEVYDDYERAKEIEGLHGITLGFPTLDRATLGLQGGELFVVAGRPSIGKSWIQMEMAYQAWNIGHSVALITMEMGAKQCTRRFVGRVTGTNPNLIRAGTLSEWAERHLRRTAQTLHRRAPLWILSGDMSKTVDQVEQMVAEHNPDLIVVDASYLLSPASKERLNAKHERQSQVVKELKQLAKSFNRPVIASYQLNRDFKNRAGRAAEMDQLAGTDSIGQDADMIMAIRPGPPPFEESSRLCDLIKNREGVTATLEIGFSFDPVCFVERESDEILTEGDWQE